MPEQHIVAMGGGGFSMEPDNPLLDDYVLDLTGRDRPRTCFLPTASGDAESWAVRYYQAFARRGCHATHLPLFSRQVEDLRALLLDQDLIYVGGGNTANMLAIWRVHGVDHILREAWASGVVLCGVSAGALCWFETGITDSFGPTLQPLDGCLGFLAGSFCPHYDGEPRRRPTYQRCIAEGMGAGFAADDGCALHFQGTTLSAIVTSRPRARAYRLEHDGNANRATEVPLPVRFLG